MRTPPLDSPYTSEWFAESLPGTLASAYRVVPLVVELFQPQSVVDIGCGIGAWLSVFAGLGISDYLGVDGEYVSRSDLRIPADKFVAMDITKGVRLDRRFDLAVCLEVAEHLPSEASGPLVASLTELASVVLFSAAIPGQPGLSHLNEQWPDYWANLFSSHSFACVDSIRSQIWDDETVNWWYRQNTLCFVSSSEVGHRPQRLVHPVLYESYRQRVPSLGEMVSYFPSIVKESISDRLRRGRLRIGRATAKAPSEVE